MSESADTCSTWTTVIRPRRSWLDLRLHELSEYRYLIWIFVWRDFAAIYKQTILGPLWFIVQPLLTTLVYALVFGQVARLPTDGHPPILFYFSGTIIWGYFSMCLTKTANTFIDNSAVFGKVYFPRLVVPVSTVVANLIHFILQFCCFLGLFMLFSEKGLVSLLRPSILMIPIFLVVLAGLALGLGIMVSSLTTRFHDLRHLVQFGVQLWMFATPVVYPLSLAPENLRWIIRLNPVSPIVEGFRQVFLAGQVQFADLFISVTAMFACLFCGVVLFNRVESTFMDTV